MEKGGNNFVITNEIYDRIADKIKEKFNDNNWSVYQNFPFDLEIVDKKNNNWLHIDGYMNLILYFSKRGYGEYCGPYGGGLNDVVPVWWDIKVAKWNDDEEEWDDNIVCDIEWSKIRDRLVEE